MFSPPLNMLAGALSDVSGHTRVSAGARCRAGGALNQHCCGFANHHCGGLITLRLAALCQGSESKLRVSGQSGGAMEKAGGARKTAFLLGRVLFGGFFLYNGINHFKQYRMMAHYARSKGVPVAGAAVLASGAQLTVGGASLLAGFEPK